MRKRTIAVLALSCSVVLATGCKKKAETTEGPMESAGEEVDEATETAGEKVEETGDKAEDAAEDATH
jgi:hypothetical protein